MKRLDMASLLGSKPSRSRDLVLAIQKKLSARHLKAGGRVLYDVGSSYFEGTHCPLAQRYLSITFFCHFQETRFPWVQSKVEDFMIGCLHATWNFKWRGAGESFPCTPQFSRQGIQGGYK
jgi:hypothetical protein